MVPDVFLPLPFFFPTYFFGRIPPFHTGICNWPANLLLSKHEGEYLQVLLGLASKLAPCIFLESMLWIWVWFPWFNFLNYVSLSIDKWNDSGTFGKRWITFFIRLFPILCMFLCLYHDNFLSKWKSSKGCRLLFSEPEKLNSGFL